MSLDIVYPMSFFINLFKTTPKNPEDAAKAKKDAVTAAEAKKAAITKECEEKHRDVDKIISDAKAELSKAETDSGTPATGATDSGTTATDTKTNATPATGTTDSGTTDSSAKTVGGKSKKKKKFSNKQNGGKNKKRTKSQKKRR